MKHTVPLSLCLTLLLGCGSGEGALDAGADTATASGPRASVAWRVRCNTEPCPDTENPARTVDQADGEGGHRIACDLTVEGEDRRMNLSVESADGYGFEVRGARVGLEGGRIDDRFCQIRIFEEADETLLASCTSSAPTPDRPCQIARVDIREVEGVPTFFAELFCQGAASEANPTRTRDVTSPTASNGAAEMVFTGCLGL